MLYFEPFWNKGTFIFRNYNFFVYINQNAKIGNRKQPHVISLKIGDCAIEIMNIPGAKGLVVVVWISVYSYVPRYLHTYFVNGSLHYIARNFAIQILAHQTRAKTMAPARPTAMDGFNVNVKKIISDFDVNIKVGNVN